MPNVTMTNPDGSTYRASYSEVDATANDRKAAGELLPYGSLTRGWGVGVILIAVAIGYLAHTLHGGWTVAAWALCGIAAIGGVFALALAGAQEGPGE